MAQTRSWENQSQCKREFEVTHDYKQRSLVAPGIRDLHGIKTQGDILGRIEKEKKELQRALDEYKNAEGELQSKIQDDIARKDIEVAELNRKKSKLEDEKNDLQKYLKSCRKVKEIEDLIKARSAEKEKSLELVVAKQKERIENLEKEKDELLMRLSAKAGRRLTDNDPDIADLSDINRPTKLAEKYSELYDNAWIDAFAYLQSLDKYKESEQDIIACLLSMLIMAYTASLKTAENQLQVLSNVLNEFRGNIDKDQQVKDVMNQLKDIRKKAAKPCKRLTEEYMGIVTRKNPELPASCFDSGVLRSYLEQCLELCWLMVIQDPPVHLKCDCSKKGELFDKNVYKQYTEEGKYVAYTVWPAVYLEKDGYLLCKGVVQCDKRLTGSLRTPANKEKGLELKTGSLKFPEGRSAGKTNKPPYPSASKRF